MPIAFDDSDEVIVTNDGDEAATRSTAMKMSHLANFLIIIVGGAVQEMSSAVRRSLRGHPRAD